MNNNSLMIVKKSDKTTQVTCAGCAEFPAHYPIYISYATLLVYAYQNDTLKTYLKEFGEDYTLKMYISDFVKFVMEIFDPINERAKRPLFEPYTIKNLWNDIEKSCINSSRIKLVKTDTEYKISIEENCNQKTSFVDDDIIGMRTNCREIRKMIKSFSPAGSSTDLNRKVQLAHTALRMIYSPNGWDTIFIAMRLNKSFGIHPFYSLWMATLLRGLYNLNYPEYGYLFSYTAQFISYEQFVDNFFNDKLYRSVTLHLMPPKNFLQEYTNSQTSDNIFKNVEMFNKTPKSISDMTKTISQPEAGVLLNKILQTEKDNSCMQIHTIIFSFVKKLFSSTALNQAYTGILVPNSRLNRIIFKDENEIMLSVVKNSKFIKIK